MDTDHERMPLLTTEGKWQPFRYYMVGKMVRQDQVGIDRGFRASLVCPCHSREVRVIGPTHYTIRRYMAHCAVDGELVAQADTMEALWLAVEGKEKTQVAVQGILPL